MSCSCEDKKPKHISDEIIYAPPASKLWTHRQLVIRDSDRHGASQINAAQFVLSHYPVVEHATTTVRLKYAEIRGLAGTEGNIYIRLSNLNSSTVIADGKTANFVVPYLTGANAVYVDSGTGQTLFTNKVDWNHFNVMLFADDSTLSAITGFNIVLEIETTT